jgi:hypothetical protein
MPLKFETAYSRGEIPKDDMTEEQRCVISVFGAMGAMMTIGMTNIETDEDLAKFMGRVRFWERFCPLANNCDERTGEVTPFPIPEHAVRSLMPIKTNVFPETPKKKFVDNIVSVYAPNLK